MNQNKSIHINELNCRLNFLIITLIFMHTIKKLILNFLQVGTNTRNLVKSGQVCGKGPTVYERITAYYDWILDNTKDATYCSNPSWDIKISKEIKSSTTESSEKFVPAEEKEHKLTIKNEKDFKNLANINYNFCFIIWFSFIYLFLKYFTIPINFFE